MHNLPFDKPGRFLRGNLHTHSTRSDGLWEPERVCAFYRQAGYDFLAVTDHFLQRYNLPITDTRAYQAEGFSTLLGAELHNGQTEFGGMWHILAVGLPADFAFIGDTETGPQVAARALAAGAFVAVAHPQWYTLTEADVRSLGDVHAIEVYNGTAIDHNDRAESWYMLDLLLARGSYYTACATDDAHFRNERADALRAWVQVKAEANHPEAILAALKQGLYYSSSGPQLYDVQITDDEVIVACSPAERVFLTGIGHNSVSVNGRGITSARLKRAAFKSTYGRITVRDAVGARAWTNPFWLA
jgi:predicted metal-dependent phosphoesterase TrpH